MGISKVQDVSRREEFALLLITEAWLRVSQCVSGDDLHVYDPGLILSYSQLFILCVLDT